MHKNNCLFCNSDLIYFNESIDQKCIYCKNTYSSNCHCSNGHYVCDNCHSLDAFNIIKTYCLNSNEKNPFTLANNLMKHNSIKMHGPEHHFLVPAVLLTAYLNTINDNSMLAEKLNEAEKRSKNILGGFCGFYGNCGAGVGTGIFMSLITNATPLSYEPWKLSNLITGKSLVAISEMGGPRCCKRDSFVSLETAVDFIENKLNIKLEKPEKLKCSYSKLNAQCLKENCKFFNAALV